MREGDNERGGDAKRSDIGVLAISDGLRWNIGLPLLVRSLVRNVCP